MGWREVLADWQDQWFADSKLSGRQYEIAREQSIERLLGMDALDRIAMARELLGTSEGVDAALATVRKAAAVYRKQPFGTDECALAWEQFNLALGALMSECMAFAKDPAP